MSRFTEGLRVMQTAWTQDRFDLDGRFWQGQGLAMNPTPLPKPYPPIWLGGSHSTALRRAVRLANGSFGAGSTTTEDFLGQARFVREEVARTRRDPATYRVAKRVYLAVDENPDVARARVTVGLVGLYGYFGLAERIGRFGVSGRPADVAQVLQSILDAGTDLLVLHPLYDEAEQLERPAADVVPLLELVT